MQDVIRQILFYGFICGGIFGGSSIVLGYCIYSAIDIYRKIVK